MSRALFLGVDGGGRTADLVCVDDQGAIVARTVIASIYHPAIGVDEAVNRLAGGLSVIFQRAGVGPDGLSYAFFGLPAYGEDHVADPTLRTACRRLLGHGRFACGNDMICAWAGSLGCRDGVSLSSDVGSICYGERDGRSARAGGWGEILGDEGSAYWIALAGLQAFTRMSDGRLARGPLYEAIVKMFGLRDDLDICERVTGPRAMPRDELARLATLVDAAALAGDAEATRITTAAGTELVSMALTVAERLGFEAGEPVPVSWSGSVLRELSSVRRGFEASLRASERFRPCEPLHSGGVGAALYARKLANDRSGRPA